MGEGAEAMGFSLEESAFVIAVVRPGHLALSLSDALYEITLVDPSMAVVLLAPACELASLASSSDGTIPLSLIFILLLLLVLLLLFPDLFLSHIPLLLLLFTISLSLMFDDCDPGLLLLSAIAMMNIDDLPLRCQALLRVV